MRGLLELIGLVMILVGLFTAMIIQMIIISTLSMVIVVGVYLVLQLEMLLLHLNLLMIQHDNLQSLKVAQ